MNPIFFFYLTGGAMVFLLASMLLGHGHHGGHGAAHGHAHLGGHSGGHGGGHGAGHAAGHATGQGSAQGGHAQVQTAGHSTAPRTGPDNMSVWSFQMLLLFVGGFGIGGYFASISLLGFILTMLAGAAGGVGLAAIGYSGINFFYRRQSDSNIPSEDYIGVTGIVVTSIAAGSVGQVRCQIGESRDIFLAKSVNGAAVPINSVVRVVDMVGTTAIVETAPPGELLEPQWRQQ